MSSALGVDKEGAAEGTAELGQTLSPSPSGTALESASGAATQAAPGASTCRRLFDAHCHLQLPRLLGHADDIVAVARRSGVLRAAVCGCEQGDWEAVSCLARDHPDFVAPQFGVHPWWAGLHEGPNAAAHAAGWIQALEATLVANPSAGVGECGLDGARKKEIPMDVQLAALRPQLNLAKQLQRPVSLHCVASHGVLLAELQRAFGKAGHAPGLVLHSYCGSAEMIVPLSKLNCFFSFSASILHIAKHMAALRATPLERLLLETDSPDQLPRLLCSPCGDVPQAWGSALARPREDDEGQLNEPGLLPGVVVGAAEALGMRCEELAEVTEANARRVFDL